MVRVPSQLVPANWATASNVAAALRRGACPRDHAFDKFLQSDLQVVSEQYWTPLKVALRAAAWLDECEVRTVVDIGSGAGKFCVAAALAGHARFVGVEQRPHLVTAARDLARLFEVEDRVTFVHGTFGQTPVPIADAYYLYNPFEEHLYGRDSYLDESIDLDPTRFRRDSQAVEVFLEDAGTGTFLVTFNGFGGEVPSSYRQVRVDRDLPSDLCMWRKG